MPGKTIKIRSTEGGEFDCYLALPARQRQGAGRGAGLRGAWRRQGPPRHRRRVRRGTASSPRRPTCSGAPCRARCRHDDKRCQERSQPRLEKIKTGERDMVDTLAHLRTLPQFNGRAADHRLLLRRALRHPRTEAARLRRRHLLPRHADARLHQRARWRHRTGLHHLGRPGSSRAAGGAGRLPPGAVAHEECRAAYLPGHPAWLHDAGEHQGLRSRRRASSR